MSSPEPGALVTHFPLTRPRTWMVAAAFASIAFAVGAMRGLQSGLHYWAAGAWCTLIALAFYLRRPLSISIHENGMFVSFARKQPYYRWGEVLELSTDVYDPRSQAVGAASWSLRLKDRTIHITADDGALLAMYLRKYKTPPANAA